MSRYQMLFTKLTNKKTQKDVSILFEILPTFFKSNNLLQLPRMMLMYNRVSTSSGAGQLHEILII